MAKDLGGPGGSIFAVPVYDRVLIYAPLHGFLALVDSTAQAQLQKGLQGKNDIHPKMWEALETLQSPPIHVPRPRTGELGIPQFLGLITTRGCNMNCAYCDFVSPKDTSPCMELDLAKNSIDAYYGLLVEHGVISGAIHFFGGEPFYASQVVHFAVEYAKARAAALNLSVRFEVITNGLFNQATCAWVADTFDTVLLSLDGPADIQDRYRPAHNGRSAFELIRQNAICLAQGECELILRTCVTHETVTRLPEIAQWFAEEIVPDGVCFESLVNTPASQAAGLEPPEAWEFARQFCLAADRLEAYGIPARLSTAELETCQVSFCPLGKDAMIVDSDGTVSACYLLPEDWKRAGLQLDYGGIVAGDGPADASLKIDSQALEAIRRLNVTQYPLCSSCFCRFHCAGGCHVKHRAALCGETRDDLCIRTRAVSIARLLKQLEAHELYQGWLHDPQAQKVSVLQEADILC
ncbi:MAG TPA: radical SAM protein [Anaerolineales bacterium]|nr:radical SAM protein [Anaerolineales bacterium]